MNWLSLMNSRQSIHCTSIEAGEPRTKKTDRCCGCVMSELRQVERIIATAAEHRVNMAVAV